MHAIYNVVLEYEQSITNPLTVIELLKNNFGNFPTPFGSQVAHSQRNTRWCHCQFILDPVASQWSNKLLRMFKMNISELVIWKSAAAIAAPAAAVLTCM